ncbi:hypothetical protein SAY87_012021 [Trapa incisa]|uniref:pectinesterase n=1 Tax=Trapa incisa TaxID=236973 RepID=A0AAN7JBV2_9MYRT|nr:hypothetical protein SAY87_012013 [Trapa incisa]KAK4745709.1 hypothetical protein SAY87_012021 [Trapa incisa]
MAPFLCFILLSLHFFSLPSSCVVPPSHDPVPPEEIRQACKATRFPDVCASSLSQVSLASGSGPSQILNAAISISVDNQKKAQDMGKRILDSSEGMENRTIASRNCLESLGNTTYRTQSAVDALPRGKMKDARAWLSAALQFQLGCVSGFMNVNDTALVNETMAFLKSLTMLTSNALGMLVSYDIYGNETGSWKPPATERDGFWEPGSVSDSGRGFTAAFPANLTVDATVCRDGAGGCYGTVQDAVNAAPDNGDGRFVIYIKAGVYNGTLEKKNVIFIGDGVGKTVITGNLNVGQPGMSTYNSATVGVVGDGFMATGITFENTAGPNTIQAVAFRSSSDFSYIENCEFLGHQDTLYASALRQYYKSCRIEGNVVFVFGNAGAIFDDCQILIRPRQLEPEKGESNPITAHGRADPSQSTGFVFHNCAINGTEAYVKLYHENPKLHKNFLGRPFPREAVVGVLEDVVHKLRWMPWSGDVALNTLYYGEFNNTGPGSPASQRVSWSNRIPEEHVDTYSVDRFIQGGEWIPRSS